jgi:hypothetical protein
MGSWSRDCSLPPDRGKGALLSYEIEAGKTGHPSAQVRRRDRRERGRRSRGWDRVRNNLLVFLPSRIREFGLLKQPDGLMHTIYNRSPKNEYTIKDGKFARTGEPAPMPHKCAGNSM